jgi:ABC-type Mn2+/Zn2+ transport system permease subunit
LGGLLTACAYLLVLVAERHGDLRGVTRQLIWGAPSMALAFLVCAVSARWLEARTALRRNWAILAAFGFTLAMGVLYLLLFRLSLWAPLPAALAADVCLIVLLMRSRTLARP